MRWLRILGIALGVATLALALLAFGARFADGPLAMLPGGPFRSGEWVEERDVDWSFATAIEEIELESGDPSRSRTVWVLVLDGEAYVPCSLSFPPGKSWHHEALLDPRAVVRVEGRRYRRQLVKVDDSELERRLRGQVLEKYTPPPGGESGVWFFHLAPPA